MACLPLLALLPSRPSRSFSSMFGGNRRRSFPPNISPCPESPPSPLSPTGGKGRGGRGGGAGLPLGTAVAQSISPKPRNFLLPKRKKKKKKIPAATFPPCPIGTVETGSVGFPGRVAQGWNTLRQEWWSSLSGPPPGPLWASPLSLPPSPPSKPPEVAFPCPQAPGQRPGWPGAGRCAALRWGRGGAAWWLPGLAGEARGSAPPTHTVPSAPPSPELGISFHKLLWGLLFPSSKVCAIFSHPFWADGRADPRLAEGRGPQGR